MKRITFYINIAIIILTLSSGCNNISVNSAIAQINAECPQNIGDGFTMTSAEIIDSVAIISINAKDKNSETINKISNDIKPQFLKSVKKNNDLAKILKQSQTNLIYRFICKDSSNVDIVINYRDL